MIVLMFNFFYLWLLCSPGMNACISCFCIFLSLFVHSYIYVYDTINSGSYLPLQVGLGMISIKLVKACINNNKVDLQVKWELGKMPEFLQMVL